MAFENPQIPEGINVSQEHPLKEFAQLVVGITAVVAVVIFSLHLLAGHLVRYIPFEFEQAMVQHIDALEVTPSPRQAQLQKLADEIAPLMDLPEGMTITAHYLDEDTVNAFATIGGHVFFFRGLMERLPSEDALAMVMAHEIAHIKHRHPMVAMGKGVTLMALAAATVGASGSSAGQSLISQSMNLGLLKFSRDQERQSDDSAVQALHQRYQTVKGAEQLFAIFVEMQSDQHTPPEVLSTHPHSDQRWQRLKQLALEKGWSIDGPTTPLNLAKPTKEK